VAGILADYRRAVARLSPVSRTVLRRRWRRRRGASFFSRRFWLYALAKIAPPVLVQPLLPATLDAFTEPLV